MSLGAVGSCPIAVQSAIDSAWAQNIVVVSSAGNDASSAAHWPASCNHTLGVASTDQSDLRSSFSDYGSWVQVAAPGSSILSTYSDSIGYGYKYLDGTSMAAPYVSGLAALLWATSYGTSAQSVVSRIEMTADHIGGTGSLWQYGRINAATVVAAAIAPVTVAATPSSIVPGGTLTVTWANIASPTSTDWIALAPVGGSSGSYITYRGTQTSASGSGPLVVPASAAAGSYELRLYAAGGYTVLATSPAITIP